MSTDLVDAVLDSVSQAAGRWANRHKSPYSEDDLMFEVPQQRLCDLERLANAFIEISGRIPDPHLKCNQEIEQWKQACQTWFRENHELTKQLRDAHELCAHRGQQIGVWCDRANVERDKRNEEYSELILERTSQWLIYEDANAGGLMRGSPHLAETVQRLVGGLLTSEKNDEVYRSEIERLRSENKNLKQVLHTSAVTLPSKVTTTRTETWSQAWLMREAFGGRVSRRMLAPTN